jgi:hypothetical protein
MFFLGILFQSITFGSFYFAVQGIQFLALTVILFSIYDSIYYTLKTDLERIIPAKNHISKNAGMIEAFSVLADLIGTLSTVYILQFSPKVTFWIIFLGGFISFIPILFIKLKRKIPKNPESFVRFLSFKKSFIQWIKSPIVLISFFCATVSEFIESLPIFLAYFEINLIQIGWILAFMKIISFITSILIGVFEDNNKESLFIILAISTIFVFIIFFFSPIKYLSWFLLIYGTIGSGWELAIRTIRHRFIRNHIEPVFGGVLDQWLDNTGRGIMYFLIISTIFIKQDVSGILSVIFVFSMIMIFSTLIVVSKARESILVE